MSRPYGTPKTEEERRQTHQGIYGSGELPPRGTGIKNNPNVGGRDLSFTQRLMANLQSGFLRFLSVIINANRDLNMHDYETATLTATYKPYSVGENNKDLHGDQSKLFVSKSTLIYSTVDADVKFNDMNSIEIDILAGNFYEFKSNIRKVFYKYSAEQGIIYIYCDGVLPEEARSGH